MKVNIHFSAWWPCFSWSIPIAWAQNIILTGNVWTNFAHRSYAGPLVWKLNCQRYLHTDPDVILWIWAARVSSLPQLTPELLANVNIYLLSLLHHIWWYLSQDIYFPLFTLILTFLDLFTMFPFWISCFRSISKLTQLTTLLRSSLNTAYSVVLYSSLSSLLEISSLDLWWWLKVSAAWFNLLLWYLISKSKSASLICYWIWATLVYSHWHIQLGYCLYILWI